MNMTAKAVFYWLKIKVKIMSTRKNTNNQCPSNALADLNDNTMIIDEFVNSKQSHMTDRLGNEIEILYQIREVIKQLITDYTNKLQSIENSIKYIKLGDYGVGGLEVRDDGDGSYSKECRLF